MGRLNPFTGASWLWLKKQRPLLRGGIGHTMPLSSHVFCRPFLLSVVPRATVEIEC